MLFLFDKNAIRLILAQEGVTSAMQTVSFSWATPLSQKEAVLGILREAAADITEESGTFQPPREEERDYIAARFEPFIVIAGVLAVTYAAERICHMVRQARHGGAVVDVRDNRLDIRANPSIPLGTVIVVTEHDVHEMGANNESQLGDILQASLEAADGGP